MFRYRLLHSSPAEGDYCSRFPLARLIFSVLDVRDGLEVLSLENMRRVMKRYFNGEHVFDPLDVPDVPYPCRLHNIHEDYSP